MGEHLITPASAREELSRLAQELLEAEAEGRQRKPYADVVKVADALTMRARLMAVVEAYVRRKQEHGLLDFADQVALAARIAREVPEVGDQLRQQHRVVLLDEYQDTSVAQLELLSNLFGHGHPVTAVGDPHQAIYGWRGASAAALATFPARFPARAEDPEAAGTRTLYLSTSWRNDAAVLDVANTVAGPLRAAQATAAESGASVSVPVLRPRPGAGRGKVLGLYADSSAGEARAVAEQLAARWHPDTDRTAAVLCRTRSQFTPVVTALRAAGLPVVVLGLGGLLATPEVVDLRSTLQAAHDPSRGDAVMRLLTNLRLGMSDLHALHDWARHLAERATGQVTDDPDRRLDAREETSLVEAVDQPPSPGWTSRRGHTVTPAAAQRVSALSSLLRQVRQLTALPLPELVVATEQLLGLDIEVTARAGAGHTARASLDAFAEVAA
ncbi:ATP-dependent helicase, partial [Georgenia sp. 10Sc9-8]|nr:ATP-dependent helicase [Georgenia halotolerans]